MSSFTAIISNIVTTLQNDADIASFCTTKWGKALTVMKVYKRRIEISAEDLPIVLITRPQADKKSLIGARDVDNTVRLYAGFQQDDREKALDEIIEFEEKIDDALLVDHTRGGNAINTDSKASVNDEGEFHPVYFIAMDVLVKHRRQ